MDERLQALLVGVGLLESITDLKSEDIIEEQVLSDVKCDDLEQMLYEDTLHNHVSEVTDSTLEEVIQENIEDFDEPSGDGTSTESPPDNELYVDVNSVVEEPCAGIVEEMYYSTADDFKQPDIYEEQAAHAKLSGVETCITLTKSNMDAVDIIEDNESDSLNFKEKLIDILLSYNINIDGRKKSSSALFNFSYNEVQSLGLDADLDFTDDECVSTITEEKTKKKSILGKIWRK